MKAISFSGACVIFDLDGVLVDSRESVDRAWIEWGARHGLDAATVLGSKKPGRRARDEVSLLVAGVDPEREAAAIDARELELVDLVHPVAGAREAVAQLDQARWGIATSGTRAIALARLRFAGLPTPEVMVTAEMVRRGKPDPEAYLSAAERLGVDAADCVAFEDAVSGVAAANAAGCTVVGVMTSQTALALAAHHAVTDFRAVRFDVGDGRIRVTLDATS